MARYSVDIQAQLKGFEEIEQKLKGLSSKPIDVKINLTDTNGDISQQVKNQLSSLKQEFNTVGKESANQLYSGMKSVKFSGDIIDFTKAKESAAKQTQDIAKTIESNLNSIQSKSTINKWANEFEKNMTAASEKAVANFQKSVQKFYDSNTKMRSQYGADIQNILAQSSIPNISTSQLKELQTQYAKIQNAITQKGLTGNSWLSEAKRATEQIGQFAITYGAIQKAIDAISGSVSELKEIDSILTEISKTSDLTDAEIKQLGVDAFDQASQWGKTASDYLLGIQEMSRSGYYGDAAEQMADLSVLAQAAGDLSADMSNSYLLASNAAYKYQGNVEKLNALLDGQNMITNRNSVSMADMAEATTIAASMASELGVAENQLSAMIGTVEARTKSGGSEVGNALKSLFLNVTNLSNAKISDTFEKAGVAQTEFINGVEQMRDPVSILEDLAKVFNSLSESDPLRNEILMNIGQKYQANKLSALLSGWSDYEKMLVDYSEGTGSAAIEAEKSANNWEGSVNKLNNAFTGLVQNFANSDVIIDVTNMITGLVKGIDSLTSALGPLGTLTTGIGLFQGIKGSGWRWENRPALTKYILKYFTDVSIIMCLSRRGFSGDTYELTYYQQGPSLNYNNSKRSSVYGVWINLLLFH